MIIKKESVQKLANVFTQYKKEILIHKEQLIKGGKYNVFNTRFAFDCWNSSIVGKELKQEIRSQISKDSHLETGLVRALKIAEIL